jgi:hypothetical protein
VRVVIADDHRLMLDGIRCETQDGAVGRPVVTSNGVVAGAAEAVELRLLNSSCGL